MAALYKTPGIPRTADGKPDLAALAPRMADGKPDFSGVWRTDFEGPADAKPADPPKLQPWAEAVAKKRTEDLRKDSPEVLCLPMGPAPGTGVGKVVQTPGLLLMLYDGTLYRQIFLDGRELQKDPNPDWMGYFRHPSPAPFFLLSPSHDPPCLLVRSDDPRSATVTSNPKFFGVFCGSIDAGIG